MTAYEAPANALTYRIIEQIRVNQFIHTSNVKAGF